MKKKIGTLLAVLTLILMMVPMAFAAPEDYGTRKANRGSLMFYLWEQAGCPEPSSADNPFDDVFESDYYYNAIIWACETGLARGLSDTTFEPTSSVTIEQAVTYIWRAAGSPEPTIDNPFSGTSCADHYTGTEYYYKAAVWAYETDHLIADALYNEEYTIFAWEDIGESGFFLGYSTEGVCGDDLIWTYDTDTRKMTISGTGEMTSAPWLENHCGYEMTEVVISDGVTSLCSHAFDACAELESVVLPNSLTSIGGGAFIDCTGLESLVLPSSVTSIGSAAFSGMSLTYFSIPDGISMIEYGTFGSCCSLSSVYIPGSVKTIEDMAFDGCSALTDVYYGGTADDWAQIDIDFETWGGTNLELQNATIHYEAEPSIFGTCGDNLSWELTANGTLTVTGDGEMSNFAQSEVKSRTESVLSVSPWSGYSDQISTVVVKSGITSIGSAAFADCSALSKVTLPDTLVKINDNAFANSTSLTGISIPEGVTDIGCSVFENCASLKAVSLPSTLSSVGSSVFEGCVALESVYFSGTQESWDTLSAEGQIGMPESTSVTTSVPENPFGDIPVANYFYPSVLWAYDEGITNGTTPTTFDPEGLCTRAQVVTFLWRSQGSPEPTSTENPFEDVTEGEHTSWYYKAVLWAVENGITNGRDETHFAPDGECLRSEVVMFLWRTAQKPASALTDNPFRDTTTEHWFYEPVMWAVGEGITTGVEDDLFGPDEQCTRAQIVTFLYRYIN